MAHPAARTPPAGTTEAGFAGPSGFERFFAHTPGALQGLRALRHAIEASGLDPALRELAYLRASQLNGCAFCIAYHVADARARGVPERKLHLLAAWHEVEDFTPVERAALAWTEALTRAAAPDETLHREAGTILGETTLAQLTLALGYINAWNRIGATAHFDPPVF